MIIGIAAVLLTGCGHKPALPAYGKVPDFVLTDQTGQPFRSAQKLNGHVWLANFIFTNCMGPCPRMTSQMKQVIAQAKDSAGLEVVTFTIDPDRDTPEVLAAYAKRFQADPMRWHFLTGSRGDLRRLSWDTFHLSDIGGALEHSTRFVLIDRTGQIRGYYETSDTESIAKLLEDIRTVTKEAA
ncbi:MAG: SCO family protein [Bryobacteraceae bacterium]